MTLSKVKKGERVVTPELIRQYDSFLLYNHIQWGNTSTCNSRFPCTLRNSFVMHEHQVLIFNGLVERLLFLRLISMSFSHWSYIFIFTKNEYITSINCWNSSERCFNQSMNQSIMQFIYTRNTKELLSARWNAYVCINVHEIEHWSKAWQQRRELQVLLFSVSVWVL